MRKIPYLSPSGLQTWRKDKNEFFVRYLSDAHPERPPQTAAMAVGSSFDAYIKSDLYGKIYGDVSGTPYEFQTLFEAQVEPQNRDIAIIDGKIVYEAYIASGALADLMLLLSKTIAEPKFESDLVGPVTWQTAPESSVGSGMGSAILVAYPLILKGKPDLVFLVAFENDACRVILDWKVNGYYSKSGVSPARGYIMVRDGVGTARSGNVMHKDCVPMPHRGLLINGMGKSEDFQKDWAAQEATYGWLVGEPVGGDWVNEIHQIACRPDGYGGRNIRVAEHRGVIGEAFQHSLYQDYVQCWLDCHDGHFFKELSRELSEQNCKRLEIVAEQYAAGQQSGNLEEMIFAELTRSL